MKNFASRLEKIEKSSLQVLALVIVDSALSQGEQEERTRSLWKESSKYQPGIEIFPLPLPKDEMPSRKSDRVSLVEARGEELREFLMEVADATT
jgi:hypothetical protein